VPDDARYALRFNDFGSYSLSSKNCLFPSNPVHTRWISDAQMWTATLLSTHSPAGSPPEPVGFARSASWPRGSRRRIYSSSICTFAGVGERWGGCL